MKKKFRNSIFISIASYRDGELIPSILDCVNKAHNKQRLFFGVCLQDNKNTYYALKHLRKKHNLNMKIVFVDWKDSKGACWARHVIQKKLYDNQTYYLQLDSHHRFKEQWDEILIHLLEQKKTSGVKKPIITAYGSPYTKNLCEPYATQMYSLDMFENDGDLQFQAISIDNNTFCDITIPARFLSAHFIFASGSFCKECIYDPLLYFRGEEITLSARAYTHGYDFFHPTFPIIWHFYTRLSETRHWDNHSLDNGFIYHHELRDKKAKARLRQLLDMENNNINLGSYGLGNIRSLHDYELFCGLNFKNKQIHKSCANTNNERLLPVSMTEEEWQQNMLSKKLISVTFPDIITHYNNNSLEKIKLQIFAQKNLKLYQIDIFQSELIRIIKNQNIWKKNIAIADLPVRGHLTIINKNPKLNKVILVKNIYIYDQ